MLQRRNSQAWGVLILTQLLLRNRGSRTTRAMSWVFYCIVSDSAQHLHEAGITENMTTAVTIQACNLFIYYCHNKVRPLYSQYHVNKLRCKGKTRHILRCMIMGGYTSGFSAWIMHLEYFIETVRPHLEYHSTWEPLQAVLTSCLWWYCTWQRHLQSGLGFMYSETSQEPTGNVAYAAITGILH